MFEKMKARLYLGPNFLWLGEPWSSSETQTSSSFLGSLLELQACHLALLPPFFFQLKNKELAQTRAEAANWAGLIHRHVCLICVESEEKNGILANFKVGCFI